MATTNDINFNNYPTENGKAVPLVDYIELLGNDPDCSPMETKRDAAIFYGVLESIYRKFIPSDTVKTLNAETQPLDVNDVNNNINYFFMPTAEEFQTAVKKADNAYNCRRDEILKHALKHGWSIEQLTQALKFEPTLPEDDPHPYD